MQDIPSNTYVIKPRNTYLGNGVIIVNKEDLDITLKYIFTETEKLKKLKDKAYNYWSRDTANNTFLIEKFYPSDEVMALEYDNEIYRPTMRAAFVLFYTNEKIEYRRLGEIILDFTKEFFERRRSPE